MATRAVRQGRVVEGALVQGDDGLWREEPKQDFDLDTLPAPDEPTPDASIPDASNTRS